MNIFNTLNTAFFAK